MVKLSQKRLEDYAAFVGEEEVREVRLLASHLHGARVQHLSSTAEGGGVAELLAMLVPLMRDAGLDASWDVIEGSPAFFEVTKTLHNNLHGEHHPLTPEMRQTFWDTTQQNLGIVRRDADFVCTHDPQPVGLVRERGEKTRWLWRCHIDLSDADPGSFAFLRRLVERHDGAIFHLPDYARDLSVPQFFCPPAIDPLSPKNCDLELREIDAVLERRKIDPRVPIVMQVSRYDRLKDPLGVIRAFKMVARSHPCQLVMVGGAVSDDPEGERVLAEVREAAAGDPDIHVLVMERGTGREVNALQRAATVVVQKSLREGFGLTVTEAMWKAKPVVGGAVGGIRRQILPGSTGFLVHSVEGLAYRIRQLLGNPDLARRLGENARRYVTENFMPTTYLKRWLLSLLALQHGTGSPVVALR
ncbi:MAG TPA: glycosyltransferase [Myxococcales bacterium]|jgi:trehalose synthase